MQTSPTPQPFFLSSEQVRQYDQEIWDDNANAVFTTDGVTLPIPMRVDGRLEIHAQGRLAAAGTLTVSVDGVDLAPIGRTAAAATTNVLGFADLTAGNHTVTLASSVGLSETLILVRRGRVPPL